MKHNTVCTIKIQKHIPQLRETHFCVCFKLLLVAEPTAITSNMNCCNNMRLWLLKQLQKLLCTPYRICNFFKHALVYVYVDNAIV